MSGRSLNNSSPKHSNAAERSQVDVAQSPTLSLPEINPDRRDEARKIETRVREISSSGEVAAAISKLEESGSLDSNTRSKIEDNIKLRYLLGSYQGMYARLKMSEDEKFPNPQLLQKIDELKEKTKKLVEAIDKGVEGIKVDLTKKGITDFSALESSLQTTTVKGLGDYQDKIKQAQEAQRLAQLEEINNKPWYQRLADPLYRVMYQSPEMVRQQVGIVYGGYREQITAIYQALKSGSSLSEAWNIGVERAGIYINDYREQCERNRDKNGIGSILGGNREFSRGNWISDLITLHPITAYSNPLMEVADAAYDEALLGLTNTLTLAMGGEEKLKYLELKELQETDAYFRAGKTAFDVAKIAGALALNPSIAATQGLGTQVKTAGQILKSNFIFSGVIASGQELKSLSLPRADLEQKPFSLYETLTNISRNTLANTANSIGMAGVTDALGMGFVGVSKLRLPQSRVNALSSQIAQRRAMAQFQLGNSLYQTVDDLNDFLDSAKDSSQNMDWSNPLNVLGHALVLGATTKDLMGDGPNDRSSFSDEMTANAELAINEYGDTISLEQFEELIEQKHEVEARGYEVDETNSTVVVLNGREVTAHYSLNREVLYFDTLSQVQAYRNKRALEHFISLDEVEVNSSGVRAFYDKKANLIVTLNPRNLQTEREIVIHRSFLVHEVAHKKGLMNDVDAYMAQAQYLAEHGYKMIFSADGAKYEIVEADKKLDVAELVPQKESIEYFISQKANNLNQET